MPVREGPLRNICWPPSFTPRRLPPPPIQNRGRPFSKLSLHGSGANTRTWAKALRPPALAVTLPPWFGDPVAVDSAPPAEMLEPGRPSSDHSASRSPSAAPLASNASTRNDADSPADRMISAGTTWRLAAAPAAVSGAWPGAGMSRASNGAPGSPMQ